MTHDLYDERDAAVLALRRIAALTKPGTRKRLTMDEMVNIAREFCHEYGHDHKPQNLPPVGPD